MKVIISREIKNYLRNPLYWIGALIIMATVFLCLKDYLNIRWYSVDEILTKPDDVTEDDADVYYGYIAADETVSEEEKYERGLDHVREDFIQVFGMSETEADEAVNDIKSRHMSIAETLSYMEEEYSYYGGNVFEGGSNIKATTEEVNQYMDFELREHSYAYWFANKFADFIGVMISFFAAVMLAFLFTADMKKETHELLHTKPITAGRYVMGKFLSGVTVLSFVVLIMMITFSILCMRNELSAGIPDVICHMAKATVLYVMPTVIASTAVCVLVSILFRNPIPAIPIMFLYVIYSNLGSYDADGNYGFYGRILGLMFRFPDNFFETAPMPMFRLNRILLLLLSGVCILLATVKWKKVRI